MLQFFFNIFLIVFFFLVVYFWLHWVFAAARRLSLVAVTGGQSSLRCASFSLWWLHLLPALVARASVALQHVGSSQTRDRTRVPCIGRQTLNHCATREVPMLQNLHERNRVKIKLKL